MTPDDAPPAPTAPDRRSWIAASVATGLVVLVARLVVSWGRREYAIWPDEPAQLAIARWVGGGTPWNMHNHSVWRPLFGTLLGPVHWFTDDPATIMRSAMVLNAVLGAAAAVVLVALAGRLTTMSPTWCALCAAAVSLAPATLLTTEFVFAESLLVLLYLLTVWFLTSFQRRETLATGAAAGICAGLAFGAHSRMMPLAAVVVGVAGLAALRRRTDWLIAAAVGAVTVATVALMSMYTSLLIDRLWNEPSTRNSPAGVAGQLGNLPATAVSLVGQGWTLLVSTLGIVVYGAVALSARLRRGGHAAGDAAIVLVAAGLCVALSVVFMSDRWRSDQLVYGRYNAAVAGPVLVVGLAAVLGAVRIRRFAVVVVATAAATVLSGWFLRVVRRELLADGNGLEPMILGLQPFVTSATTLDVVRISAWAALWTLVLGGLSVAVRDPRTRQRVVASAIAVALVVGTTRAAARVDEGWDDSGDASAVAALRGDVLADGIPVDFQLDSGSNATMAMMLYQFYLPRTPFTVVVDPTAGAPGTLVFAPTDDEALTGSGARQVWRDPRRDVALWRR